MYDSEDLRICKALSSNIDMSDSSNILCLIIIGNSGRITKSYLNKQISDTKPSETNLRSCSVDNFGDYNSS